MRMRVFGAVVVVMALALSGLSGAVGAEGGSQQRRISRREAQVPADFVPAAAMRSRVGRYYVVMKEDSLAQRVSASPGLSSSAQQSVTSQVRSSQAAAIADVEARGGRVVFRYSRLINAFSARLSAANAAAVARRSDVASVQPVGIVKKTNASSVPFIGAPRVWNDLGVRGQGMRVAVVDTGIDYTHADFGGPGTVQAYENNNPTFIEEGTFPTAKVIGGYDFVGEDYDVVDEDTSNDTPRPDEDPLDFDGHGTHVAGTCCGKGIPEVGAGVAPAAKLYAYRVWDVGNSTDDVLVAAYERAVDPNEDGNISDAVDVLQFSGGVTYGTLNSVEARAAQRVVNLGTVFVASAGNEGNQPAGGSAYTLGTPAAAPGVVSVASSIDQFVAQTLEVNTPPGTTLPEQGIIVHQDWSAEITSDITDDVFDARAVDPPSSPSGQPSAADRQLCDTTPPGNPFVGQLVLVFKGSTGEGDCDGTTKVFRAQQAGAIGVILWSGFGGSPFALGPGEFVDQINIPAVMVSGADGEALGDAASPNAPGSYNTGDLNVTINAETQVIPGFEDRMSDFSSEGPARLTNDLKPDISAPGSDITSAGVGTGDGASVLSGTSMAAPHISGVATLLRQIHPNASPAKIKALLMNQAFRGMKNNDGSEPVPATVMGAGRVRAFQSATAKSVAYPSSLSYGLRFASGSRTINRSFKVENMSGSTRSYDARSKNHYSDFDPAIADVSVSSGGSPFQDVVSFTLPPGGTRQVRVRLQLDPSVVSELEQEFGWYFFHPNVDGYIQVRQLGAQPDTLNVPWHVAPLAASDSSVSTDSLDLTSGSDSFRVQNAGVGVSHADMYLLGGEDEVNSFGEEDVTHIGARSFTGANIDGTPRRHPRGTDALAGISWIDFLTSTDVPEEPIEFGVRTEGLHNTTESLEVDVLIDSGADGVFADQELQADYMAVKIPGNGLTCLFDLALADPFAECAEEYFPDYSNYNTNVTGVVVDARAIGLTNAKPNLSYMVTACTGRFSGDAASQICDDAGDFDSETGTYTAQLRATNPALRIRPQVCGGFWTDNDCTAPDAVSVERTNSAGDTDPSILVLFPNNSRANSASVITTSRQLP